MGLLFIVLAGQFMAILDVTIVNVGITTIQDDLGASGAAMQLVVGGYTIAYAVLLVTGARLGDLAGHRRLFLIGLGLFTAASLACGLAPTTGTLIAFRLAQGAGAALMVPQVLSLIQRSFDGTDRARALSIYATVIAGAAVAGQIAGGILVDLDVAGTGWRPVFLVNVPIGVLLLVAGARWLPSDDHRVARGLDPLGLLTLAGAVLTFVVPLVLGREQGWPLWCWLGLATSIVLFAAFVAVERRSTGQPLVPARLLRVPGLVRATAALGAMMAAYGGYLFVAAMHLQRGLGFSPLRAGLTFAPGALAFALASLNWRRVPARWHRTMIGVGLVVSASGLVVLALTLRGGETGGAALFVGLVLFGGGMGAGFSPLMTRALAGVPVADAADASGVLATVVQLAQVVGVATFGTLMLELAEGFAPAGSGAAFAAAALAMGALMLAAAALVGVRVQARAVVTSPPIEG
jgi:EmrB/QacA subfamily drug resistance transporter